MLPIKDDNPTRSFPAVTVALIVLNVLVFLAQLALGKQFTYAFAMVPRLVSHAPTALHPQTGLPIWTTIFTSMFLHGGVTHLGGNMLFLWIFGNNTEDTLGKVRYLLFYFTCGLAAAGLHIALGGNSAIPTLGASGAIAGVLGAYIHLFPRARVTTLIFLGFIAPLVELPAALVLGLWFLMNFYQTLVSTAATLGGGPDTGGVAFSAHVGGFIAGWLLIRLLVPRRQKSLRERYSRPPRFFDDTWG